MSDLGDKVKCKSYTLRDKQNRWVGQIIISSDGAYTSITDYGNFNFAWRSFGQGDFREFLLGLDEDYFSSKMIQGISYLVYNNSIKKQCEFYTSIVLPLLKEELKKDLNKDND